MDYTSLAFCLRVVIFLMIAIQFADMWRVTEQRTLLEKAFHDGVVSWWWVSFQDLLHIWGNTAVTFVVLRFAFAN
jgi:hypothetical protein